MSKESFYLIKRFMIFLMKMMMKIKILKYLNKSLNNVLNIKTGRKPK